MSSNISTRLAKLWSGLLSLWMTGVEVQHPEIAYENAIQQSTQDFLKLKNVAAAVISRRDKISTRLTACKEKLADIDLQMKGALDTNQDDLALLLIQQKEVAQKEFDSLTSDAKVADSDAEKAKSALMSLKANTEKLKAEKDSKLASLASNQARIRITEQLDGMSSNVVDQTLASVREHIANVEAKANLTDELHESDLDVRLGKLKAAGANLTAKSTLDALKRERAAQLAVGKQM